jgi:MFS-type transporter involved in bile tolerance (Atg22 family)
MYVAVLGLVLVVCLWLVGDVDLWVKLVLTLLYLATFAFLLSPEEAFLFTVSQCALVAINGAVTFGMDYLGRR